MTERGDGFDEILDQVRARSGVATPQRKYGAPGVSDASSGKGQSAVLWVVGIAGVLIILFLLLSASGGPSGGVAPVSAPGVAAAPTMLTAEGAAEVTARFCLALLTGDAEALEMLVDPTQLPVPSEIVQAIEEAELYYADQGGSPSSSIDWQDGSVVVAISYPEGERVLICTPDTVESDYALVEVVVESDGGGSYSTDFGLIASGGGWKVETIDDDPVWGALY